MNKKWLNDMVKKCLPYQGIARRAIIRNNIRNKITMLQHELGLSITDAKEAVSIVLYGKTIKKLKENVAQEIENYDKEIDLNIPK